MFQLNLWCDRAMSLLAGQGIEKAQSLEGAQHALGELEEFFGKKVKRGPVNADSVSTNLEVFQFLLFFCLKQCLKTSRLDFKHNYTM